jgi:23S rRNA pseudouridine1911/1915/1917 synthase
LSKKQHSSSKNLQVLFEDNHLIVINKRPGDIVQGDKTGDLPLSEVVKLYLKEKYIKQINLKEGSMNTSSLPFLFTH